MEDKKDLEIVQEKTNSKKTEWTPKKVITTIVIAILALLMIGGLYYIVILVQQGTDESNVFGKYDGTPIKYEANSVFYNTLNSNSAYLAAVQNNDINTIYSSWYQAFQSQVLFTALSKMAEKAEITTPQKLVDKLLINSGVYAAEDGSKSFDENVYASKPAADKANTYQYFEKMYPYYAVISDYQTLAMSEAESAFVANLAKNTRTFDYYVVDYNAYPDELAKEYDISEMAPVTDADGNTVEPTMSQIKAYIYSKDQDAVKPYIEEAIANAAALDFEEAANTYGNGVYTIENAVNNIGNSSYMYTGIQNLDTNGYVARAYSSDLAKELYTEEAGYVTAPVEVNGSYVVVKIKSIQSDDSAVSFINMMYSYYNASQAVNDLASSVVTSDKLEDHFMEKFMPLILGQMGVN